MMNRDGFSFSLRLKNLSWPRSASGLHREIWAGAADVEWMCKNYLFYSWTEFLLWVPFRSWQTLHFNHQARKRGIYVAPGRGSWHLSTLLASTKIPLHNPVLDYRLTRVATSPFGNLQASVSPHALFPFPTRKQGKSLSHSRRMLWAVKQPQ